MEMEGWYCAEAIDSSAFAKIPVERAGKGSALDCLQTRKKQKVIRHFLPFRENLRSLQDLRNSDAHHISLPMEKLKSIILSLTHLARALHQHTLQRRLNHAMDMADMFEDQYRKQNELHRKDTSNELDLIVSKIRILKAAGKGRDNKRIRDLEFPMDRIIRQYTEKDRNIAKDLAQPLLRIFPLRVDEQVAIRSLRSKGVTVCEDA